MTEPPGVRWNNLFDDLESQLEHELSAEELDLRVEEERLRLGRMSIRDRLCSLIGSAPVTLVFADDFRRAIRIGSVGKDWLAGDIADSTSRLAQCIVPMGALAGIDLSPDQVPASLESTKDDAGLSARLALPFALRDLSRRRRAVDLTLTVGTVHGTIDRVGQDHFDFALHEKNVPRRQTAVSGIRLVPFSQLQLIRL